MVLGLVYMQKLIRHPTIPIMYLHNTFKDEAHAWHKSEFFVLLSCLPTQYRDCGIGLRPPLWVLISFTYIVRFTLVDQY